VNDFKSCAVRHWDCGWFQGQIGEFCFYQDGVPHPRLEPDHIHWIANRLEAQTWIWDNYGRNLGLRDVEVLRQEFDIVEDWRP